MVLEKTLESPLDSKDIKPVSLKGNQPRILIAMTDAEAEAPNKVHWGKPKEWIGDTRCGD